MFRVEGIDHVALNVRDVRRSVEWYRDVLGLERRYEEAWGDQPAVVGAGTTSIALFTARGEATRAPAGPGAVSMRHLAFRVDRENFERARQELAGRGIELEFQDHQISHSIYLRDPDGYEIEITTYEK